MPEVNSIRLFPHSSLEFDGVGQLADFLENDLYKRRGIYRVPKVSGYSGLRPGDLVIFHKDRRFVGEARVAKAVRRYRKPLVGPDQTYEGEIVFDPKSIRVYVLSFDTLTKLTGRKVMPVAKQTISIQDYQAIVRLR
jgi:hypothetical protein